MKRRKQMEMIENEADGRDRGEADGKDRGGADRKEARAEGGRMHRRQMKEGGELGRNRDFFQVERKRRQMEREADESADESADEAEGGGGKRRGGNRDGVRTFLWIEGRRQRMSGGGGRKGDGSRLWRNIRRTLQK
jgi:hypothetical protein